MTQISQQIIQRVAEFIQQNALLPQPYPEPLYVGLSGGPDSVALLHILKTLGYQCVALHCNFHLRGQESNRDQFFCLQLCNFLLVPLEIKEFDTKRYMAEHKMSLEMAARKLRYDWWKEFTHKGPSDSHHFVALGHHLDDSIETMLMNLMRGTGIQGLTGIVPRNDDKRVIRPLLSLTRQDIMDYLRDNQLSYVVDHTNAENDTIRNQIRNRIIPLMEEVLPQARHGIASTLSHLRGTVELSTTEADLLTLLTSSHNRWGIEWKEASIDLICKFCKSPETIESFVFEWERRFCNPQTHRMHRNEKLIYTAPIDESVFEEHKPTLESEVVAISDFSWSNVHNPHCEFFDADKGIQLPLKLRRWKKGDRMIPLGMEGHSKLVSDLFSNQHYSPMQKATTWIVTDASDQLLWVVGLRSSDLYRIDRSTTRILKITVR